VVVELDVTELLLSPERDVVDVEAVVIAVELAVRELWLSPERGVVDELRAADDVWLLVERLLVESAALDPSDVGAVSGVDSSEDSFSKMLTGDCAVTKLLVLVVSAEDSP